MYDLMKYHCDYLKYPGIDFSAAEPPAAQSEMNNADLVRDLDDALRKHGVKIAAAFARIRIERRAAGITVQQQVENILPEEVRAKENLAGRIIKILFKIDYEFDSHSHAVEMPKTVRINFLKATKEQITQELRDAGYKVKLAPIPTENQDYDDEIAAEMERR
jgi:hypothetical protein